MKRWIEPAALGITAGVGAWLVRSPALVVAGVGLVSLVAFSLSRWKVTARNPRTHERKEPAS